MKRVIEVLLLKPLPSAANLREHWATRARRVKAQRELAAMHMLFARVRELATLVATDKSTRVTCTLTRIAPRRLDTDNLGSAFKAIRDEVAKQVGIDDGSLRWWWTYAQEVGPPAYRIELGVTP